jgi:MFS family permease
MGWTRRIRRAAEVVSGPELRGVLGQRPFLRLFAGVTFSRVGDAMTFIVVSWLALRAGGPRAVGLVALTGGCAGPVTAPVIGHLVDRIGLRPLMLADNLIRGSLMVALATLSGLGLASLGCLVAFAAGARAAVARDRARPGRRAP